MVKVRTRAIDEITTFRPRIDPVDQIVLAIQYDISKWLSAGYAALVRRESPLECDEAKKLGVDTMCLIAKARERYRSGLARTETPGECDDGGFGILIPASSKTAMKDGDVVDRLVQDIFWPVSAKPLPVPDVPDVRRFFI